MSVTFSPAIRDRVGLIIGMIGSTGSGKTLSSLKMARGLAAKPGEDLTDPAVLAKIDARIGVIDTEAMRATHYAPAAGELPGPFKFGFQHADMRPPFSPESYMEAILAADKAGFEVILTDSFSHSWDGEGGLQDIHIDALEDAVNRAKQYPNFDEYKVRERASMGAWKEPKARFRRLVSKLLQCRAHLVICMRADEKLRMETVEEEGSNGRKYKKTIIIQPKDMPIEERWIPIVEKRFPYELTMSLLFVSQKPGVPIPIKLQEQHRSLVPLDRPISEETGRMMAEWSRGGSKKTRQPAGTPSEPDPDLKELEKQGDGAASCGLEQLRVWWNTVPAETQKLLRVRLDTVWKPKATAVSPS